MGCPPFPGPLATVCTGHPDYHEMGTRPDRCAVCLQHVEQQAAASTGRVPIDVRDLDELLERAFAGMGLSDVDAAGHALLARVKAAVESASAPH